jgi:glycosyltransferase involved in cell wall biosynthesis
VIRPDRAESNDGPPQAAGPLVSIICIYLNELRFLAEAVGSVLDQDYGNFELLLIDDGSVDGSADLARDFATADPRVRCLAHADGANHGCSASRNLGLGAARGEFVTFIDADDVWPPHKLSAQTAILQSGPDIGLVCGAIVYWNSWAGGIDRTVRLGPVQDETIAPPDAFLALYPVGIWPAIATDAMVRRDLALQVGGFEDAFRDMYEEQTFFAKIMLVASVYLSSDTWLNYRQHPESSVPRAHRTGKYRKVRADFLRWLDGHLAQSPCACDPSISAAVRRELWLIRHPVIERIVRRMQRGPLATLLGPFRPYRVR